MRPSIPHYRNYQIAHTHTHLHLMEVSGLNHDLLFICSTLVSRTSSPIVITLRIQWKINISHRLEHKSAQSTIHCVYRHSFYILDRTTAIRREKNIYITKSGRRARMKKKQQNLNIRNQNNWWTRLCSQNSAYWQLSDSLNHWPIDSIVFLNYVNYNACALHLLALLFRKWPAFRRDDSALNHRKCSRHWLHESSFPLPLSFCACLDIRWAPNGTVHIDRVKSISKKRKCACINWNQVNVT